VLRAPAAKAKGAAAAVGTVAQMDRGSESLKLAVGDVDFELHQLVDLAQQADPPTATLTVASLESALLWSDFSLVVSSLRSATRSDREPGSWGEPASATRSTREGGRRT
jgi:hypothetical protein